ncbi:hypothetical protein LTS18_007431 [Coniosporium uncinatum]|uniref:Uncharacterized protein n=1 Tax=Coniosporium uncinatum TaxID=93489 RepID=A0ACC3D2K8_9PEZI|nr:hypothetical protein LTS18_007431 [Coniosporium uncinatum]
MTTPSTLCRSISPPPTTRKSLAKASGELFNKDGINNAPSVAAVEAGKAHIEDHLSYFTTHLKASTRPVVTDQPCLSIANFAGLYQCNQHAHGHHFVVHQHNHPVAGCHYDLRLQISLTSSVSFAIPYGLPGNPNSLRPNRMAIETRVHNLWNHLTENASHASGSMLIWDTGEYEILPRYTKVKKDKTTDDEMSAGSDSDNYLKSGKTRTSESDKLAEAFKGRYIRLRLNGTKLPKDYTITLRLPSNDSLQRKPPTSSRPARKRRRKGTDTTTHKPTPPLTDSDSEIVVPASPKKGLVAMDEDDDVVADASDDEAENATIRATNAYTGATNSVGSVHQRHWFLTLDKNSSGFGRKDKKWVPVRANTGDDGERKPRGFEPFFVMGADVEESVVTGRTSAEVMADENVEGFMLRKMWRPITE